MHTEYAAVHSISKHVHMEIKFHFCKYEARYDNLRVW